MNTRMIILGALVLAVLPLMAVSADSGSVVRDFDYVFYGEVPTTSAARFQDPRYLLPPELALSEEADSADDLF